MSCGIGFDTQEKNNALPYGNETDVIGEGMGHKFMN